MRNASCYNFFMLLVVAAPRKVFKIIEKFLSTSGNLCNTVAGRVQGFFKSPNPSLPITILS